jgi:hypothetical protein
MVPQRAGNHLVPIPLQSDRQRNASAVLEASSRQLMAVDALNVPRLDKALALWLLHSTKCAAAFLASVS